jgi:hypothetical protein
MENAININILARKQKKETLYYKNLIWTREKLKKN